MKLLRPNTKRAPRKAAARTESASSSSLHRLVIRRLREHWLHKARECAKIEKIYMLTDRVTGRQAAAAKEVYRTCVREMRTALAQDNEQAEARRE